jgi:hypothetical protein
MPHPCPLFLSCVDQVASFWSSSFLSYIVVTSGRNSQRRDSKFVEQVVPQHYLDNVIFRQDLREVTANNLVTSRRSAHATIANLTLSNYLETISKSVVSLERL